MMKRKKKSDNRVGKKISILRHEGESQRQAVGKAMGMSREGRLTKEGSYIRAKKKRHAGRGSSR